ncbi:response regulator [Maribellus sediminis]|uniref:ATP-binding response regulator n=1 Tax=Maribellus sediminis TaxID=2696285 RepID=UPI0014308A99|nr:response regulator [Maribellus sediminis]
MRKILAVDDHPINLDLLEQIIKIFYPGFEFLGAKSGEEGITRAIEFQPDLILLDIMMPGLNGYDTCKELKKDPKTKHIPIIMVSALGHDSNERIKGLDAGADSFLSKPFDKVELRAQINVALRIKDYQERLKSLNAELLLAEERERRRIAENLHDCLGQTLSLAYMNLTSIDINGCAPKVKKTFDFTTELINKAVKESRSLTYDLSPPILYELGLIPAVKWKLEEFESKHKIQTQLYFDDKNPEIKKEFTIFLFRIVVELLNNIVKHAKASNVEVRIESENNLFKMTVTDNGCGIDTNKIKDTRIKNGGFGLFSISERMENINGSFHIQPAEKGTVAEIVLPLYNRSTT